MKSSALLRGGLAILMIVALSSDAQAESRHEQDFAAANELALKGNLEGAIRLYESLLEAGVEDPDVLYNLGGTLAEAGRLPEAVLSYERALRLDPSDSDARANLDRLRTRLLEKRTEEVEATEPLSLGAVAEPLLPYLPLHPFAWAAIAGSWLLFGGLFARRRAANGRRWSTLAAILGVIALVAGGTVVGVHALVAQEPYAVALTTTPMKVGPHERFEAQAKTWSGERLRVTQQVGTWLEVQRADGVRGWIPQDSVGRF